MKDKWEYEDVEIESGGGVLKVAESERVYKECNRKLTLENIDE